MDQLRAVDDTLQCQREFLDVCDAARHSWTKAAATRIGMSQNQRGLLKDDGAKSAARSRPSLRFQRTSRLVYFSTQRSHEFFLLRCSAACCAIVSLGVTYAVAPRPRSSTFSTSSRSTTPSRPDRLRARRARLLNQTRASILRGSLRWPRRLAMVASLLAWTGIASKRRSKRSRTASGSKRATPWTNGRSLSVTRGPPRRGGGHEP